MSQCFDKARELSGFLGSRETASRQRRCLDLAYRPFVWDVTAATLRWSGTPKTYVVGGVETMNDEEHLYRASVHVEGQSSFDLHFTNHSGELRLKLFDTQGRLYAARTAQGWTTSDYTGAWTRSDHVLEDGDTKETVEHLQIVDKGQGTLTIQHEWKSTHTARRGMVWNCNRARTAIYSVEQLFGGSVSQGQIVAKPKKDATYSRRCRPTYSKDRLVRLERDGDTLLMYRTDGSSWPEVVRFRKQGVPR